jgi:hypothetical protein
MNTESAYSFGERHKVNLDVVWYYNLLGLVDVANAAHFHSTLGGFGASNQRWGLALAYNRHELVDSPRRVDRRQRARGSQGLGQFSLPDSVPCVVDERARVERQGVHVNKRSGRSNGADFFKYKRKTTGSNVLNDSSAF